MKIGFFDSGLGGLTVLREVVKELPEYDYVYYADTRNLPYGDKTEEEIYSFTKAGIVELFKRDCLLVIVACNTASAETLRRLQDSFLREEYPDKKVLGVIIPTIEEVVTLNPKRAILLATTRTVESGKYGLELAKKNSSIQLESIAMPELVPMIEQHDDYAAIKQTVGVLKELAVGEGDVVILGCTHYTVLTDALRTTFPATIFISQDEVIPKKLSSYLGIHPELQERLGKGYGRTITLSEHKERYHQLAAEFLGGSYLGE